MEPNACNKNPPRLRAPAQALYVHVPFCRRKCRYCDFYSLEFSPPDARRYLDALATELSRQTPAMAVPAASIFIGGGTPTALPTAALARLLALVGPLAGADTEFTVEANPGTLTGPVVEALVAGGVNRVSVGVQSFLPAELHTLGRIHSPAQARRAFAQLRRAGLTNLSLDLIYGIPGQTLDSWRRSLGEAFDLGVDHLSCYCLTLEPGTPLWADRKAGRVADMDEETQRLCYDAAIDLSARAGLAQYELSNFARPGRPCRHNLTYWHNEPYVGVGPGAAGYLGGRRWTNRPDVAAWSEALLAGRRAPARGETLTGLALMAETLMLGLRLTEGVDRGAFAGRFGRDPLEALPESLSRHQRLGSLIVTPGRIRLAREYYFTSNAVLADVVGEGQGRG